MRVSEKKQQSEIRIADLRVEISRAISGVYDKHPGDLTHEEIVAALIDVSAGWVRRLLPPSED